MFYGHQVTNHKGSFKLNSMKTLFITSSVRGRSLLGMQ